MLENLIIKNFALIECVEINFTKGLNVLSGETGAGKSVIIESLNFVLGAKADKAIIRAGTSECFVQAVFDVSKNYNVKNLFNEYDIDEDDTLIVSRRFTLEGKNSIKINGSQVTVSVLKKFTTFLLDVHGQSEHFYLLKTSNQLSLIDKCGGDLIVGIKNRINDVYFKYKNTLNQLKEVGGDESQRLVRLDILRYQVNEIESADFQEDEEEKLTAIKQKLENQERIITGLNTLKGSIVNENGINDMLGVALRSIVSISNLGSEYLELAERVQNVFSEIDDISAATSDIIEDFDVCQYDIDSIEERIDVIKSLKKKYGNSFESIQSFLKDSKLEIEKLENYNEIVSTLMLNKSRLEKDLYDLYVELDGARRDVAMNFSNNIISELKELGMPNANFKIIFKDVPDIGGCNFNVANGFNDIEFYFTANNGEPLKPLSSVISGGEMSRFMLSIKTQTAKFNEISTFIFDEIDAGISGVTAKVVAEKFAQIAKDVQIIAISHLPQISSMADNNLLILKIENEKSTKTIVRALNESEKVLEIVRLIGGKEDSVVAVSHAKELILQANKFKS